MQYFGFSIEGLASDVYIIEIGDTLKDLGGLAPTTLELTAQGLRSEGRLWLQSVQNRTQAYKVKLVCNDVLKRDLLPFCMPAF